MPGRQFDRYLPADIARPLPEGFTAPPQRISTVRRRTVGASLALLAFLWMIGMTLRDWWRRARSNVSIESKAILHGCIAVILALLIEALFEHNLGDSEVLSMFWIVVASGYRTWEAEV